MNSEKLNDDIELIKVNYPLSASAWKDDSSPINNSIRLSDPTFIVSKHWNQPEETRQALIIVEERNLNSIEKEISLDQSDLVDEMNLEHIIKNELMESSHVGLIPEMDVLQINDLPLNNDKGEIVELEEAVEIKNKKVTSKSRVPNSSAIKKRGRPKKIILIPTITPANKSKAKKKENSSIVDSSDFYSWLELINQTELKKPTKAVAKTYNKPKLPAKSKKILEIERSIKDSQNLGEEVISETLADLLTQQGHKDQAVRMYQKLALKYPEKSSIFALLIKNLKS